MTSGNAPTEPERAKAKTKNSARSSSQTQTPPHRDQESNDSHGLDGDAARLQAVEETLQYQFQDPSFLTRALTHSSAKSDTQPSNERLEFLGDAILGLVVTDHLFRNFEASSEGVLTRLKSVLVSSKTISAQIRRLKLDRYLIISRGLQKNNSVSQSMCADLFEAIIGAIYLDGGIDQARAWILRELKSAMSKTFDNLQDYNWKSRLQQYTQKHFASVPSYVLEEATGPDHCPSFAVTVYINDKALGHGEGPTKKGAQQAAAKVACSKLMGQEATRVDISDSEPKIKRDPEE